MTEAEWLAGTDLDQMLKHCAGEDPEKAICRKLYLFGCACCRRIWPALNDERSRKAVEIVGRYADDLATDDELEHAIAWAWEAQGNRAGADWVSAHHAPYAVSEITTKKPNWVNISIGADQATFAVFYDELRRRGVAIDQRQISNDEINWEEEGIIRGKEEEAQLHLLRDIFGNPFYPARLDPSWLLWNAGAVRKMARVIYTNRAFYDLPILGDALEEAGCTDSEILSHCRGLGLHVRGCWVVDLVLARE
jgi:hypothetical protein